MQVKVVRYGDGIALVPDQALVEKADIVSGTTLDAAIEGTTLIISLSKGEERHRAFQEAVEEMDQQYGEVFRRLAE